MYFNGVVPVEHEDRLNSEVLIKAGQTPEVGLGTDCTLPCLVCAQTSTFSPSSLAACDQVSTPVLCTSPLSIPPPSVTNYFTRYQHPAASCRNQAVTCQLPPRTPSQQQCQKDFPACFQTILKDCSSSPPVIFCSSLLSPVVETATARSLFAGKLDLSPRQNLPRSASL